MRRGVSPCFPYDAVEETVRDVLVRNADRASARYTDETRLHAPDAIMAGIEGKRLLSADW